MRSWRLDLDGDAHAARLARHSIRGWLDLVDEFTQATRNEPGNLWFEWSRSVDDPNEFVLVEAFMDDAAEAHVKSDHFV